MRGSLCAAANFAIEIGSIVICPIRRLNLPKTPFHQCSNDFWCLTLGSPRPAKEMSNRDCQIPLLHRMHPVNRS